MPGWSSRLWPRNLAGRTALLLLASLTAFHLGSLWMHQHGLRDAIAELGDARLLSAARTIVALPADERDRAAHDLSDPGLSLGWNPRPSVAASDAKANSAELQARLVQGEPRFAGGRLAPWLEAGARTRGSLPLADGTWLNFALAPQAPASGLLGGADAVASTSVMAVGIVGASLLLVRWLTRPLRRLAMEEQGGTLTLANRPGGGLRAVIRFPIARPPAIKRNGSGLGNSKVKREENPHAST